MIEKKKEIVDRNKKINIKSIWKIDKKCNIIKSYN